MRRFLKWALVALAAVGCWAAIQQARHAADLPAVQPKVVLTRPGVAPDVIQVTYFSSDVRCATCIRIERLTGRLAWFWLRRPLNSRRLPQGG